MTAIERRVPTHTLKISVPLNLDANPAAETYDVQDALAEALKVILPLVGLGTLGLLCDQPNVTMDENICPHCPDGHRRPGSRPMAVWVGPERDSDGEPTTLHVTYAAGYHVSEAEAMWLRDLIAGGER